MKLLLTPALLLILISRATFGSEALLILNCSIPKTLGMDLFGSPIAINGFLQGQRQQLLLTYDKSEKKLKFEILPNISGETAPINLSVDFSDGPYSKTYDGHIRTSPISLEANDRYSAIKVSAKYLNVERWDGLRITLEDLYSEGRWLGYFSSSPERIMGMSSFKPIYMGTLSCETTFTRIAELPEIMMGKL